MLSREKTVIAAKKKIQSERNRGRKRMEEKKINFIAVVRAAKFVNEIFLLNDFKPDINLYTDVKQRV